MLSQQKVKAKPPPLCLPRCDQDENNGDDDLFCEPSPIMTSHAQADAEENHVQSEFYQQFENTLSQLLQDEELVPFNLHTAASLGMTSSVRHLIERCSVDPNSRNSGHWTAIMYASLFSHNETMLYLLEMKADVNMKNPNGRTPLMLAALCGSEETIKLLLSHGALLEEQDRDQFTALMLAIQSTHCESAKLLLDHGANPNVREEIHGQTPLYIAAQNGQFAIARALIHKGVSLDAKTSSGDTAYHVALRNGYSAIANMIEEARKSNAGCEPLPNCDQELQRKKDNLFVAPAPTRFKPKSPYTAFFERFSQLGLETSSASVPQVVIQDVDGGTEFKWAPSPAEDTVRCSPDGIESPPFNPFNAWPGSSAIFKQAMTKPQDTHRFKRSISKPCPTPTSPWSMFENEPCLLVGSSEVPESARYHRFDETPVKLPKDLSSVLANLGLGKYQMHFEEQDIDLQVFLTMSENDLREIGINSLGARRKFLSTIEYFQTKSNYYQIGEEYLVSAKVHKSDLNHLKRVWAEMVKTADDLCNVYKLPLFQRLVRLMNEAETFFKKYC